MAFLAPGRTTLAADPPADAPRAPRIGLVVAVLILAAFLPMAMLVAAQVRTIASTRLAAETTRVEAAAAAFRSIYRLTLAHDLDRLTDLAGRLPPPGTPECDAVLARAIEFQPHHANLIRVLPDGRVACAAREFDRSIEIADRVYFRRGRHATGPYLSEMVVGRMTGKPLQMMVVPLRDAEGRFDGMLVAGFRIDWLAESVLASRILGPGTEGALGVTLLDRLGRIEHAAPPDSSGGERLRAAAMRLGTAEESAALLRAPDTAGRARIYALAELDAANGIVLAISMPETAAFRRAEAASANSILTLALLGAAILALALRVGHIALVRPIRALEAQARALTEGREARFDAPDGPREVRELARELAGLARTLLERSRRIAESNAELRRIDHELKAFTLNASRTLQSPLAAAEGAFAALETPEPVPPADRRALLAEARGALARMRRQIRDTLTFAEVMRDGEGAGAAEPCDLAEIVRDVRTGLEAEIAAAGAEITVEPLPRILGHPRLLAEMFRNLLLNALAFARPGRPPRVRVRQGAPQGEGWIVVDVADDGIGIAPEDHEAVFQPFRRLARDGGSGTGIGLAICSRIALGHGGRIGLTSAPGEGAVFHIHLPSDRLVSRAARSAE